MKSFLFIIICFYSISLSHALYDPVRNATIWDSLLKKYVTEGQVLQGITLNVVDYDGLAKDADFTTYLNSLATANVDNLNRTEFYSFFINVYNALAMSMIINNACEKDLFGYCGPINSIEDIGTLVPYKPVWDKPAGTVAGKSWTLDDVEDHLRNPPNNILIDPRLHSAIVCASISCPNVRKGAYTIANYETEVTENFNNFVTNTKKGMSVSQGSNTVTLSSIYDWFSGDFTKYVSSVDPSNSDPKVIDFFLMYLYPTNNNYAFLQQNRDSLHYKYFDYNWDVNALDGKVPCSKSSRPCYPLWALLVTIGAILLVAIIIVIIIAIRRRRAKKSGYNPIQ